MIIKRTEVDTIEMKNGKHFIAMMILPLRKN